MATAKIITTTNKKKNKQIIYIELNARAKLIRIASHRSPISSQLNLCVCARIEQQWQPNQRTITTTTITKQQQQKERTYNLKLIDLRLD